MSTLGLVFISLLLLAPYLDGFLEHLHVPFQKDECLEVLCSQGRLPCTQNVRLVAELSLDRGRARERSVILEEKSHPDNTELLWEQALRQLGVVIKRGAGPSLNLLPDLLLDADELVLGLLSPHVV